MASYSVRKLSYSDYSLISKIIANKLEAIKRRSNKAWVKFIDLDTVLDFIFHHEDAYILDEAYIVVYDITVPWYSKDITILSEMLVGNLGRKHSFDIVPHFLETQAREAGCQLAFAGTALAHSDKALASLYARSDWDIECLISTKRI